jgi:hypothetical protein
MEKLIVKTKFEVTTTAKGKIFANVGDVLLVSNRDAEHFKILKLNNFPIFSRWMRKSWVLAKCN